MSRVLNTCGSFGYQGRYLLGNAPATIADAWCSSSTATQTCHPRGNDIGLLRAHATGTDVRLNRMPRDTVALIITNAGGTPVRCPPI